MLVQLQHVDLGWALLINSWAEKGALANRGDELIATGVWSTCQHTSTWNHWGADQVSTGFDLQRWQLHATGITFQGFLSEKDGERLWTSDLVLVRWKIQLVQRSMYAKAWCYARMCGGFFLHDDMNEYDLTFWYGWTRLASQNLSTDWFNGSLKANKPRACWKTDQNQFFPGFGNPIRNQNQNAKLIFTNLQEFPTILLMVQKSG